MRRLLECCCNRCWNCCVKIFKGSLLHQSVVMIPAMNERPSIWVESDRKEEKDLGARKNMTGRNKKSKEPDRPSVLQDFHRCHAWLTTFWPWNICLRNPPEMSWNFYNSRLQQGSLWRISGLMSIPLDLRLRLLRNSASYTLAMPVMLVKFPFVVKERNQLAQTTQTTTERREHWKTFTPFHVRRGM